MKVVRKALNLTLKESCDRVAERGVSISEGGLSNIENGNKQASDRILTAWAEAHGINPLDVWHGPLRDSVQPGIPAKRKSDAA